MGELTIEDQIVQTETDQHVRCGEEQRQKHGHHKDHNSRQHHFAARRPNHFRNLCAGLLDELNGAKHPASWYRAEKLFECKQVACSCILTMNLFVSGELDFVNKLIPNKKRKKDEIIRLVDMPKAVSSTLSKGPRVNMELANLSSMAPKEKALWVERARIAAILGSSARVLPSVRSGIRCFLNFAGTRCVHVIQRGYIPFP